MKRLEMTYSKAHSVGISWCMHAKTCNMSVPLVMQIGCNTLSFPVVYVHGGLSLAGPFTLYDFAPACTLHHITMVVPYLSDA